MQPPLTECARQILEQAQSEARSLNQEFVGTEHLILALMGSSDCHASSTLRKHHVDVADVRFKLLALMSRGTNPPVVVGPLPLSPKAQRSVNSAIVMAQSLREEKVSTRTLMLVLLEESAGPFAKTLAHAGIDLDALKRSLAEKPAEPEN